jgi:cbb3-type cytochrome oxidase maturation protein
MSVVYVALPVALLLGAAGMYACVRCIWDGQYDDLESPPIRILIDDQKPLGQPQKRLPL